VVRERLEARVGDGRAAACRRCRASARAQSAVGRRRGGGGRGGRERCSPDARTPALAGAVAEGSAGHVGCCDRDGLEGWVRRRRARKEGAAQAALRQRVPAEGGAERGGPRTSCTGELGCVETVILEVFASALTERESEPARTRGAKASAASAHRPSSVRVREESAAKVRRTGRRQARPETFATSGRTADRETTQVADEEVKAARRESSRRSTRRSCRLGLGRCTFILQRS